MDFTAIPLDSLIESVFVSLVSQVPSLLLCAICVNEGQDSSSSIRNEIHEKYSLLKSTSKFQTGHLTSSVGSGVLGSTLVAGLVTAGPALTVGLFAGTVLTSVGGSRLGQTGW